MLRQGMAQVSVFSANTCGRQPGSEWWKGMNQGRAPPSGFETRQQNFKFRRNTDEKIL
jgi:hypothetical protein